MDIKAIKANEDYTTVAIIGYCVKTFGKANLPKINKIGEEFNLDKINKEEAQDLMALVNTKPLYSEVFMDFMQGTYTLDDLKIGLEEQVDSLISPYAITHEKVLADKREFNKLQREGTYLQLLVEESRKQLLSAFKDGLCILPSKPLKPLRTQAKGAERELTVMLSDWHVGALVYNTRTGGYNFTKLRDRLNQYQEQIVKIAKLYQVTKINVVNLGDTIEHINMRNVNQAFEAEFPATEQIAKATRLLLDFLTDVSQLTTTNYYMVGGNHDRFQGNKKDAVYNDNAGYLILDSLLLAQELGSLQNVTIYDNRKDVYYAEYTSCGKTIAVDHGDHLKGKGDNITKVMKDHPIDILLTGHVHNYSVQQEDYERLQIVCSSTMGANNYSKELKLPETTPSQTMFVLGKDLDGIVQHTVFLK